MLGSRGRYAFAVSAVAGALIAADAPSVAADLSKRWEVGGGLAYSVYDNDSTVADDFATSVRGGYHFGPHHGAELGLQFQSTESGTRGSTLTYDIDRWAINYLFNFVPKKPESKVAPLVLFGAGQMHWDTGDEKAGSTLLQTGGGVRVLFTKWMALRVDGRLFHYYGDRDLLPRDSFFAFDADVGVSFFFGG